MLAQHLYREGRFELADEFVQEAQLPGAEDLKAPYIALHTVLQQVMLQYSSPDCSESEECLRQCICLLMAQQAAST